MSVVQRHWSRDQHQRADDAAILEQAGLSFQQDKSGFCRLKGLDIARYCIRSFPLSDGSISDPR